MSNSSILVIWGTGLPWWLSGKESACHAGATADLGLIPGWEDLLEEEMAVHCSILAWPWTEEPGIAELDRAELT